MQQMRMASALLGLMILTSGCATCRTPLCSKPRACKPCKTNCENGDCGTGKCERGPLVPFRNACQERELSHNFLGRIARWATYRPLCAETPCDCGDTPRCHPPLYTYFTPSQYNRTYEPVDCGGGACRPGLFGGIFGNKSCGSCDGGCSSGRSCWTMKITLPRISFTRDCGDCQPVAAAPAKCTTGCKDNMCGTRCMMLPRPISNRACENSSAGCKDKDKDKDCGTARCGLGLGFGGGLRDRLFGGCGACGLRGRLGGNTNTRCCSTPAPDVAKVDVNHVPILPPNAVIDVKPGEIEKVPKGDPFGGTKPVEEVKPGPSME